VCVTRAQCRLGVRISGIVIMLHAVLLLHCSRGYFCKTCVRVLARSHNSIYMISYKNIYFIAAAV